MISHQVQLVIPAQAGIQRSAALDTGFCRCDEGKGAICAQIEDRLNIVANQNELWLLFSLLIGVLLGAVFFGGLWWSVQRAMASTRVALWLFGSLLLRTVIVLGGFYLACGDDWQRWLAALFGFGVARVAVTRLTRLTRPNAETAEGHHAA